MQDLDRIYAEIVKESWENFLMYEENDGTQPMPQIFSENYFNQSKHDAPLIKKTFGDYLRENNCVPRVKKTVRDYRNDDAYQLPSDDPYGFDQWKHKYFEIVKP
ncbi:hypothetical protein PJI17_31180, partial [Mycobacterium kansasii]